jgi:hypothetical protein
MDKEHLSIDVPKWIESISVPTCPAKFNVEVGCKALQ